MIFCCDATLDVAVLLMSSYDATLTDSSGITIGGAPSILEVLETG